MKDMDGLVIGSPRDLGFFQEGFDERDGVAFVRTPGGPRTGSGEGSGVHVPALETLWDAMDNDRPRRALVLSPYPGMSADAARLMDMGIDVRTAGPLPAGFQGRRPPITEVHRSQPGFPALLAASRHGDFGDPVYLRMVSSPEGWKWRKWWCVFQLCRKAAALLDAPLRRVYVAAAGQAPRMHVSVTLKTKRDATGHLLVAPAGSGMQDDLFFLGTGGTLSDDPLLNRPGVYGRSDYRMLPMPARRRLADLWDEDATVSLTGDELAFYHDLLRAMGDSSVTGSGVCLEYPAA